MQPVPITLLGGGEIKFGVTVHELVGNEQFDPAVLLSSTSTYPAKAVNAVPDGNVLHAEYWSLVSLIPISSESDKV